MYNKKKKKNCYDKCNLPLKKNLIKVKKYAKYIKK